MATISRLKAAEISNGNVISADDIEAELDQLVNEMNSKESRIDDIEGSNITLAGVKTFSSYPKMDGIAEKTANAGVTIDGLLIKDGIARPTVTSDPTPTDGDFWYNSTTDFFKAYINGTTKFIPTLPTPSGNGGKAVKANSAGTDWEYGPAINYACLVDSKSTGTDGGTFTSGAWRTRDLTAEQSDVDGIVTLSANRFTLGAGSYVIRAYCPASQVNGHKAQLYNVTYAGAVSLNGCQAALCDNSSVSSTVAIVAGRFTITGTEQFEIQHQCGATKATTGFGKAAGFSTAEIYTIVELWKVA